jgi:biotin carboxylase
MKGFVMSAASNKEYVIIIGASDLVMPAYRIAREDLKLGIIAVDYNPDSPGMRYADTSVVVSTKEVDAVVAAITALRQSHCIKGVFTCGADVEITVAAVAEALNLPGIPVEVARRCNDKLLMHRYLDQVGFGDKAKYRVVTTLADVMAAADLVGFPCIVKPLDNCASRGVQRVETREELVAAYELAVSFNGERGGEVLIEECLEGSKHTIEMIAYEDTWHLLSIIDTHYISPRWPCETGLNTTVQPQETQDRMFAFSEQVSRLIGIGFNAHKVDINLAADGTIKLIELTARLSGGFHCQYASPLAFGSNDIRAALKLSVGLPLDHEDIRHQYERGAAVSAVFPEPGRIVAISGVDEAKKMPGVAQIFVWKKPGDTVGPYFNSADRPAFVIAGGATTAEAVRNAEMARDAIRIETVKGPIV